MKENYFFNYPLLRVNACLQELIDENDKTINKTTVDHISRQRFDDSSRIRQMPLSKISNAVPLQEMPALGMRLAGLAYSKLHTVDNEGQHRSVKHETTIGVNKCLPHYDNTRIRKGGLDGGCGA